MSTRAVGCSSLCFACSSRRCRRRRWRARRYDPDKDVPAAASAPRADRQAGPVPARVAEPFFQRGARSRQSSSFARRTGRTRRRASRRRCGRCRRRRAAAAKYMLALARDEPVEVGRRRASCSRTCTGASRSWRRTTRTTRRAAGCGGATRRARSNGPGACPRGRCPRPKPSWCAWTRCARSRDGAMRSPPPTATCSASLAGRARPKRCSRRRRRWRRRPPPAARTRGPGPRATSSRSTGGCGPRRRSTSGVTAPPSVWTRSRRRCPRLRRPASARAQRPRWCRAAWCSSTPTATRTRRRRLRLRWARRGWTPISTAARVFTARSRCGSSASARAPRRCSTRLRSRARRRRTTTCTRRRCTRARAATRRWATARRRPRITRASRPNTRTTATPTMRACVRQSWPPTPRTRPRPRRSWRRSPSAIPRAIS